MLYNFGQTGVHQRLYIVLIIIVPVSNESRFIIHFLCFSIKLILSGNQTNYLMGDPISYFGLVVSSLSCILKWFYALYSSYKLMPRFRTWLDLWKLFWQESSWRFPCASHNVTWGGWPHQDVPPLVMLRFISGYSQFSLFVIWDKNSHIARVLWELNDIKHLI
jgi:hypothetical protein